MRSLSARPLTPWWPIAAALVIAITTWPVASLTPTWGLDPSWRIALHMAVARGIDFGDIAFTYGPLGFLQIPLNAEAHTFIPSILWVGLLQLGLAYLTIECARRTLGWAVALVVAFIACRFVGDYSEVLPLVALLWAALVIQWGVPPRVGRILLPVSGFVCAVGVLSKFNSGVATMVCAAVAAWWLAPGRWRSLGIFAGSVLASAVVLWVAMGNAIGGLIEWVRTSIGIAGAYSAGQPFEDPTRAWEYPLFIVVVAGVVWFVWDGWNEQRRARRIVLAVLGIFFTFTLFKHGFVRHDLGHTPSTFASLLVLPAAVMWRATGAGRLAGVAACLIAAVGAFASHNVNDLDSAGRFLDVSSRIEAAGEAANLAVMPGERGAQREEGKAAVREHHYIPVEVRDALRGHTVHIEPSETSIAWAFDLDWKPLPSFQDYIILTNALDRQNADVLSSPDAPERVLRHAGLRVDSHSPEGEGPEQLKALICNYQPEVNLPGWLVLRHAASRCSPERPISSVSLEPGEITPIPPAPSPDEMVLARMHLRVPFVDRLRTVLFKPQALPFVYFGTDLHFEIPADVASGPVLMRVPASVGWEEYADGLPYQVVNVANVADPVRIDFVAVRVAPPNPSRAG